MTYHSANDPLKVWQQFSKNKTNPYLFASHRHPALEEKDGEDRPLPHEEAVNREQDLTIFENDEGMRRLFKNDFEAYQQALANPDLMIERMEKRMAEIEANIERNARQSENFDEWWQEEFWGDEEKLDEEFEDWENDLEDDPLYEKAHKWALRLHGAAEKIYFEEKRKDPDLYRALINLFMVPAKVTYGSFYFNSEAKLDDLEYYEAEVSLHGLTLAMIFLRRVRQSLTNLINKKFKPTLEWQAGRLAADEIALELQSRMLQLARILQNKKDIDVAL